MRQPRGQFTASEQELAVGPLFKADAGLNALDLDPDSGTLLAASEGHGLFLVAVPEIAK